MGLSATLSFLILCFMLICATSQNWTRHTVLDRDGRYHLYWTVPEDKTGDSEITFKVEVESHGYIGIGFSPNGGMPGSDIVTGWVKDGEVYFQDRYAVGFTLPLLDDEQNYELISGQENETHTIFTFRRKLDTCDDQDMAIDESTMRVIYAFSEEDPESEDPFYHGQNRGVKSIILLQNKDQIQPNINFSSWLYWDMYSPGIDLSTYDTLYWCNIQKSPVVSEKHHIVYMKPLIEDGHEQFVHHIVVYECVGGTPEEYEQYVNYTGYQCYHPEMPAAMTKCEGLFLTWAVGGLDIVFPEHVGMPLEPGTATYYRFEIHYDNPQLQEGIFDQSAFRMYYTPNLREYDAGSMEFGSTISPRMFIPPGQPKYTVTGHSNPDYLRTIFPETGIKVMSLQLHSHLLGRQIRSRRFRGNKEISPLAYDLNYNFHYQEYRYFPEEVLLLPGDQISVECTYDSTERSHVTFGGLSTREEMCMTVVLYYPRVNNASTGSFSAPTYECINEILKTNFSDTATLQDGLMHYDWEQVNISQVQNFLMKCEHESQNSFGYEEDAISFTSYPKNLKPYVRESTCDNETCSSNGICTM